MRALWRRHAASEQYADMTVHSINIRLCTACENAAILCSTPAKGEIFYIIVQTELQSSSSTSFHKCLTILPF